MTPSRLMNSVTMRVRMMIPFPRRCLRLILDVERMPCEIDIEGEIGNADAAKWHPRGTKGPGSG
jgi:hypothetical protein